jgi:L-lysine 6-transaminase
MPNSRIIESLSNYILTDGFHIVVDLEKSHGSFIVDAETGKEYLDCYSQFASQPLGWNHPSLTKARWQLGQVALQKIANSDMYSMEYETFVKKFAEITPDFKHYFFIDGGALGVENALKASFDWKAQKRGIRSAEAINKLDVLHLADAFHGRTGYTLSLTNTDRIKTKWFPKFDWTTAYDLDHIERYMHDDVAAIIVEPIQGEGGDNHFPPALFRSLRKLADEYESMLIFDEVQTGVGMTGKMWAYEHFGVVPDMLCFGKKTQVCGFCSTGRIDEEGGNVFNVSGRINSTWGGNLVDMVRFCHIADAVQSENLLVNAKDVGQYLLWHLRCIEGLDNVRGRGLMIAFDLPSTEERDKMMSVLQENMLALNCGDRSIRLRPHLTFSKEDANLAHEYISKALEKIRT